MYTPCHVYITNCKPQVSRVLLQYTYTCDTLLRVVCLSNSQLTIQHSCMDAWQPVSCIFMSQHPILMHYSYLRAISSCPVLYRVNYKRTFQLIQIHSFAHLLLVNRQLITTQLNSLVQGASGQLSSWCTHRTCCAYKSCYSAFTYQSSRPSVAPQHNRRDLFIQTIYSTHITQTLFHNSGQDSNRYVCVSLSVEWILPIV